jgi:hypothetical protein
MLTAGYDSWQGYLLEQVRHKAPRLCCPPCCHHLLLPAPASTTPPPARSSPARTLTSLLPAPQVLLGRDNSFARAIAQGNLEPGAPILKAAAYDLDVLQELSISLEQLAEFVFEVAPTAGGCSGWACWAAERLGRSWIGVSPTAGGRSGGRGEGRACTLAGAAGR